MGIETGILGAGVQTAIGLDGGKGTVSYCRDCTNGEPLDKAVWSDPAWRPFYDMQAREMGMDPRSIRQGSAEDRAVLTALGQTLDRLTDAGLAMRGSPVQFSEAFGREAGQTARMIDAEAVAQLNSLSATGALPAANAPGAALAADLLPVTQVANRASPKNPAAVAGTAIGAALAVGVGTLNRPDQPLAANGPLPPHADEMGTRPKGMTNPDLRTTTQGAATAMADAPDPCKTGDGQNHHIVPAGLMTGKQDLLEKIGFKLDQPANMIRLPQTETQQTDMEKLCGELRPLHSRRHGPDSDYGDAVNEQLGEIERQLGDGELTPSEARAKVGQLMDEIRGALRSGQYDSLADPRLIDFIRNIRL